MSSERRTERGLDIKHPIGLRKNTLDGKLRRASSQQLTGVSAKKERKKLRSDPSFKRTPLGWLRSLFKFIEEYTLNEHANSPPKEDECFVFVVTHGALVQNTNSFATEEYTKNSRIIVTSPHGCITYTCKPTLPKLLMRYLTGNDGTMVFDGRKGDYPLDKQRALKRLQQFFTPEGAKEINESDLVLALGTGGDYYHPTEGGLYEELQEYLFAADIKMINPLNDSSFHYDPTDREQPFGDNMEKESCGIFLVRLQDMTFKNITQDVYNSKQKGSDGGSIRLSEIYNYLVSKGCTSPVNFFIHACRGLCQPDFFSEPFGAAASRVFRRRRRGGKNYKKKKSKKKRKYSIKKRKHSIKKRKHSKKKIYSKKNKSKRKINRKTHRK